MSDGKCARSQLVLKTYQALEPTTSQDELLNVAKMAATVELLQSFFLIIDDVIDHSKLRRGKPCWYTMDGVGLTAILDGLILDKAIDLVIDRAIPSHPRKLSVLKSIFETNRKTLMGQRLDCDTTAYKTLHAFHLADVSVNLLSLKPIAYKLGYLFQAQDDYLDCFEDPSVTGKSSNDLAERKCTWITCKYLEKLRSSSSHSHLQLFDQHFGRPEKEHIEAAKQMILDKGVHTDFQQFQKLWPKSCTKT
uniref:Farnesyl pyrophosphate synthase n=1 Tax=Ditylenchus dipsaci TaxID=166011 RepID=A0A915EMH9_9BILA